MTDIASALADLLGGSEPLETVLDRHFAPSYRQRTNGHWDNREGFAQHIAHLREVVADIHVEVLDEHVNGHSYADRHVITVTKQDGSTVIQEVYVFALLDDHGRFEQLEEVTLLLTGDERDRDMGRAK